MEVELLEVVELQVVGEAREAEEEEVRQQTEVVAVLEVPEGEVVGQLR